MSFGIGKKFTLHLRCKHFVKFVFKFIFCSGCIFYHFVECKCRLVSVYRSVCCYALRGVNYIFVDIVYREELVVKAAVSACKFQCLLSICG